MNVSTFKYYTLKGQNQQISTNFRAINAIIFCITIKNVAIGDKNKHRADDKNGFVHFDNFLWKQRRFLNKTKKKEALGPQKSRITKVLISHLNVFNFFKTQSIN